VGLRLKRDDLKKSKGEAQTVKTSRRNHISIPEVVTIYVNTHMLGYAMHLGLVCN